WSRNLFSVFGRKPARLDLRFADRLKEKCQTWCNHGVVAFALLYSNVIHGFRSEVKAQVVIVRNFSTQLIDDDPVLIGNKEYETTVNGIVRWAGHPTVKQIEIRRAKAFD